MPPPHATIAILSIGQMGLGISSLLLAHNFHVITNVSARSAATKERARSAGIEQLASDEDLVMQADYVLSIVPPVDAPNHGVFLYSSATAYAGAFTLNSGEKLIGQPTAGTTFDAVFGISPPSGTATGVVPGRSSRSESGGTSRTTKAK